MGQDIAFSQEGQGDRCTPWRASDARWNRDRGADHEGSKLQPQVRCALCQVYVAMHVNMLGRKDEKIEGLREELAMIDGTDIVDLIRRARRSNRRYIALLAFWAESCKFPGELTLIR